MSPSDPSPILIEVRAPLDVVRVELVGLGATYVNRRSVALALGEHLILLDYDTADRCATIAIGGDRPADVAGWLMDQLSDRLHRQVRVIAADPVVASRHMGGPPRQTA